jgi:chemotaxis protein MotB
MKWQTAWRLAVVSLVAGVACSGCVTHRAYRNMQSQRNSWKLEAERTQEEVQRLRGLLDEKGERVTELADLVRLFRAEEAARVAREETIRKVFAGLAGVEGVAGGGRLTSSVFFRPGRAELSPAGQKVLQTIAQRLKHADVQGLRVTVNGHTDSDRVVKYARQWPKGNLQLSGARALNVADFLIKQGVTSSRVSFAGFGPHRPIASNRTVAGKARNRRVEVLLTSPEERPVTEPIRELLERRPALRGAPTPPPTGAGKGAPDTGQPDRIR